MQFSEIALEDGKTLVLLPGTACTWTKTVLDAINERMGVA